MSTTERAQLEAAIAALEAQRERLGAAVADPALEALRTRLAALSDGDPAAGQALRVVTFLFLDVVGSTSLSQRLDPEETHAVLDGALARCTAVVENYRGKVLQYAGDNLLAAFGADLVREDDAERAVRCGLALLDEGRALGDEVRRRYAHDGFDVRVGLHTGGVLLGGGVDGDGTIRGVAVHVAARMEQTAAAGTLRISHATYAEVRGVFEVDPEERIAVRGIDAPMATYLVRRAKPRSFRIATRGIEGVETRTVGRDAESALLRDAFLRLYTAPRLAMVTVVAEAGVGKSRLVHDFQAWAETRPERAWLFRGRAHPMTLGQPYGLLRDLVARRMQIADGDTIDAARRKIEAGIAPLFEADEGAEMAETHAHLLGHLIGIDFDDSRHLRGIRDDARQIRNRGFHAAAQLLRHMTKAGPGRAAAPVIMLLEDLHWADEGTLDFLDHVVVTCRDVPLLVLCLARPSLYERRAGWGGADDVHCRIDLAPLGPADSRALAGEMLKKLGPAAPAALDAVAAPNEPGRLIELVARRADGNPFYMEELVKMLIDQGAIMTAGDAWTLHPDKLKFAQLPTSLAGVLQARLDALPPPERNALKAASVVGPVFWDRALAAIDRQAPKMLPALTRRELTVPQRDAAFDDVHEYAFGHHLLHQATYGTVLKATRRQLHARVAAWLAARTGARAYDFLGATADHYERAGDPWQACVYLTRAAEHAKGRYAHELALAHVERGLALLDDLELPAPPADADALRWRLVIVRDYALSLLGRRAEQAPGLDEMEALAERTDDDARRAMAGRRRAMYALRIGDAVQQERAARRSIDFAERAGDVECRLESQRLLADALGAQGDAETAETLGRAGLAEAQALGLRRTEGVFLNLLSYLAAQREDHAAGLAYDELDLAVWRELGDPQGESVALGNVGASWLWFGQLERARHDLERAYQLGRTVGAGVLQCAPLGNLSQVSLRLGDAVRALDLARRALEIARAVGATDFEVATLCHVGAAELALGHPTAAADVYARAEAVGLSAGLPSRHDAVAGSARAAFAAGDVAGAMAHVERLLEALAEGDAMEGAEVRLILHTCHEVLAAAGDPRAAALLARAHEALESAAAKISDPALRESFLLQIPEHRAIAAAWAARA